MKFSKDTALSILNSIDLGIEVFDADFNFVFINDYEKKYTYGNRDLTGRSCFEFFSREELEECGYIHVLETGEPIRTKIITYTDTNNARKISNISIFPLWDSDRIEGIFAIGAELNTTHIPSQKSLHKLERHIESYNIEDLIGNSEPMKSLREQIIMASNNPANVFITGETGTGKEIVAQSIYSLYNELHSGPFVAFNCAAAPPTLLESILFGTVKGSFTGAENNPGLFEKANGGVIFLDEINLLPIDLQGKLLRVIQERKVQRIGSTEELALDFKLISSSNISAAELLAGGFLKEDLFYRLNVISINTPPLRDHKEDIPLLADHFLNSIIEKNHLPILGFDDNVYDYFMSCQWRGNVRELRNLVERSCYLCKTPTITLDLIRSLSDDYMSISALHSPESQITAMPYNAPPAADSSFQSLRDMVAEFEKKVISEYLTLNQGNISKTARQLDLPKQTLYNKIKKYDL